MQATGSKHKFIKSYVHGISSPDQLQIYEFKGQDFEMSVKYSAYFGTLIKND
jgi:hypothetical protein